MANPTNATAAAAAAAPAAQASNANLLAQARAARGLPAQGGGQVAGKAQGKGKGKGSPAVAKVAMGGRKRPAPNPALVAARKAATVRRNVAPAVQGKAAASAAALQASAQVQFLARRHNVCTLAGTHYHYRKVGTGSWLVQVGKAPTVAGAPAANAPVLGIGTALVQCVAISAAHAAAGGAKATPARKPRKVAAKASKAPAAPQAATQAPAAPAPQA